MGKATIQSEIGEGEYNVKFDYGKSERDSKVTEANKRLNELIKLIADVDEQYFLQEAIEFGERVKVNAKLNDYIALLKYISLADAKAKLIEAFGKVKDDSTNLAIIDEIELNNLEDAMNNCIDAIESSQIKPLKIQAEAQFNEVVNLSSDIVFGNTKIYHYIVDDYQNALSMLTSSLINDPGITEEDIQDQKQQIQLNVDNIQSASNELEKNNRLYLGAKSVNLDDLLLLQNLIVVKSLDWPETYTEIQSLISEINVVFTHVSQEIDNTSAADFINEYLLFVTFKKVQSSFFGTKRTDPNYVDEKAQFIQEFNRLKNKAIEIEIDDELQINTYSEIITNLLAAIESDDEAIAKQELELKSDITKQQLSTIDTNGSVNFSSFETAKTNYINASGIDELGNNQKTIDAALNEYNEAYKKLLEENKKSAMLRYEYQMLDIEKTNVTKQIAYWQNIVIEETKKAWCADYTESANGEVATIEIPGENKYVVIAPEAKAPTSADGILTAREIQTPEQVFFNAAILPGWQKFKPTFRRATITSIDTENDLCDVTLEDDKSSANSLGINKISTIKEVDIEYMTCNSAAFDVGDKVILKFVNQNWDTPKIIGFVDHPKPCAYSLSGIVQGGSIVANALHSFTPTQNAWEKVLKSADGKNPGTFYDESKLGKQGTQYETIAPTMYSGAMSKAVALIMGGGRKVNYSCVFYMTHGLYKSEINEWWLVEISQMNGVIAMKLPLIPASATSDVDALSQAVALFGGLPSGAFMPAGQDLINKIASKTVIRLADASAYSDYFSLSPFVDWLGWTINDDGSEWHNTCVKLPESGSETKISRHYKTVISITKNEVGEYSGNATLSLVASGALTVNAENGNEIPFIFNSSGLSYYQIEASEVTGTDTESVAPIFVCYQNNVLEVINLKIIPFEYTNYDIPIFISGTDSDRQVPYGDFYIKNIHSKGGRCIYSSKISTSECAEENHYKHKIINRISSGEYVGVLYSVHRWGQELNDRICMSKKNRDAYYYERYNSKYINQIYHIGMYYSAEFPEQGGWAAANLTPSYEDAVSYGYNDTEENMNLYNFIGIGTDVLIYKKVLYPYGLKLDIFTRYNGHVVDIEAEEYLNDIYYGSFVIYPAESAFGSQNIIYGNVNKKYAIGTVAESIALQDSSTYNFIGYV